LCALMCRSFLMMHSIDCVNMISCQDLIFCFQSGFERICSCTVLIVASALILFRHPDQPLSSTLQTSS
jgi:hypothetical protein